MDKYNNKVINSLWIGERLSPIEQLCINSYLENGHEFHLYIYDYVEGIPEGCMVVDANVIIPKQEIFLDSRGIVASFSDWFRYKLLYKVGGWWVDTDNICIRSYDIEDDYCFATEGVVDFREVTNGILKAPKGAEFLKDCIALIEDEAHHEVLWGRYGPALLRLVLSRYDHVRYIRNPSVFCPIYYPDYRQFLEDDFPEIPFDTLSVHLWNEMWRVGNINKYESFHDNSFIEHFKRLYIKL